MLAAASQEHHRPDDPNNRTAWLWNDRQRRHSVLNEVRRYGIILPKDRDYVEHLVIGGIADE